MEGDCSFWSCRPVYVIVAVRESAVSQIWGWVLAILEEKAGRSKAPGLFAFFSVTAIGG
jgi:hypothetical protein